MLIDSSALTILAGWTPIKFEKWLTRGLITYFSDPRKRNVSGFAPVDYLIDRTPTLFINLLEIFEHLSDDDARENMNLGISRAFSHSDDAMIINAFMKLAGLTKCRYILRSAPNKIDACLSMRDDRARGYLLNSFLAISSMARDSGDKELENAYFSSLRRIVESPVFPYQIAGAVLTVFCQINPEKLDLHLKYLREYLDKYLSIVLEEKEEEARAALRVKLIRNIKRIVGNEILKNTLSEKHCDNRGIDWWQDAIKCVNYGTIESDAPSLNSTHILSRDDFEYSDLIPYKTLETDRYKTWSAQCSAICENTAIVSAQFMRAYKGDERYA